MLTWLDDIPYHIFILFTIVALLAPFWPMLHVMEKLIMLKKGELRRPIDIFDLFYHLMPLMFLMIRIYRDFFR